ncbi:hypothetical protein BVRB_8g189510 [Beta vulgaris subsp. vulgaris]|uniref:uncharacterized protein LOC104901450 n=1 Tax=Beta vulgaris subsp. vulgaris TaxID=3555 RepID=UPI00053F5FC8|nr:uncharacterized protein LOC104901450 [Beta vulgaris subsp. vulgaris]KMT03807.1 hypothetical protein BVRB_8g189510 [Beta vulgaris subsp. vulgaris]
MEKAAETVFHGSKHSNLNKSFGQCLRFLLTAFPFEDFSKAFPRFTGAEQQRLYQLYVQVITSLHENLQDEFESICHETQVGTILDTVEHFVEQQSLDPLCSQKTNLAQLKHDLLASKKNEVRSLEEILDKVEDQKHSIKARIKVLKKKNEDPSVTAEAAEKLRCAIANFGSYSDEVV